MNLNIVLTGLAGAGKSQLTSCLGRWIQLEQKFEVCYVNLDAGAEWLPYTPNADIRSFVRVDRIMRDEALGINGAIVIAAERSVKYLKEIVAEISAKNAEFTLVDCPGQHEIFVFRKSGPETTEALQKLGPTIALHIMDAQLTQSPSAFVTALVLASTSHLRLAVPTINVVNKVDLVAVKKVEAMLSKPKVMLRMIEQERSGAITDMALGLLEHVEYVMTAQRPILVSALRGDGMPQLYKVINEAFCACGDLT